jgi:phosphopantothenoylcysteine decarboxylase/phosphopantothenate--cysteine ligase
MHAESSHPQLAGYEVIVGVCGGIAAYKVCSVVSDLVQRGAGVSVAMTAAARRFVTPLTFQALTGRQVFTSLWSEPGYHGQQHIQLTESADLMLVAPATANILAKAACGMADDLISTMVLSAACPLIFAPSMNTRMLENPAVQHNIERLHTMGHGFIEPGAGWLACRTEGKGRMAEPDKIVEQVVNQLRPNPPSNRRAEGQVSAE